MNKENLFLLGSGSIQLINALEAFDHFLEDDAAPALLLSSRERRHPKEHQELVDLKPWGEVHWTEPTSVMGMMRPPRRFLRLRKHTVKIQKLLAPYRGCRRLFLSQYSEFNRHLVSWLKPEETIYITDGMEVAGTSLQRANELASNKSNLKTTIRRLLYGWNPVHPDSLTFFSAIRPTLTNKDTLITNRYDFISEHFRTREIKRDAVVFVGQPIYPPRTQRYSFGAYWSILAQVVEQEKITEYWPHPKEDLDFVRRKCETLGITSRTSPFPIEIALLKEGCPQKILSYSSTALCTCKAIFATCGPQVYYVLGDENLEQNYSNIVIRRALQDFGISCLPGQKVLVD